jgi:putative glutamine amidotransferase
MYPYGIDSAIKVAKHANGILITGGEDVYPGYYGQAKDTVRCGIINRYRDSLETALIELAVNEHIPLIGICRGEQMINVTLGGSLIIDIPADIGDKVKHASKDWELQWHEVYIVPGTILANISKVNKGKVSSSHHQAINRLADDLIISAYATDSIPEAVEWKHYENKGFLMATQWHPEHMDYNSPLSSSLAKLFLKEASKYSKHYDK